MSCEGGWLSTRTIPRGGIQVEISANDSTRCKAAIYHRFLMCRDVISIFCAELEVPSQSVFKHSIFIHLPPRHAPYQGLFVKLVKLI